MTHNEYRTQLETNKEKAERKLYDEYVNYVYTIVYNRLRSCGSREDIGECVADVFMDVYTSYDRKIDISGDIKGFIGTVASRKAATYFHRLSKNNTAFSIDDEEAQQVSSDEDITGDTEKKEVRTILLEAVNSLGEPDSTIIMQKYFYDRSSGEIAKSVDLSPITVRVRCNRALKKLRSLLAEKDITI